MTGGSRGIGAPSPSGSRSSARASWRRRAPNSTCRDAPAVEAFAGWSASPSTSSSTTPASTRSRLRGRHLTTQTLEEVLAVNLVAPLRLCRALAPGMAARGYGRIVNVSSVWSVVAKPGRGAYAIEQGRLNGLDTRRSRWSSRRPASLVNAVAPGFVATELTRQNNSPANSQRRHRQAPARPARASRRRSPSWSPSCAPHATRIVTGQVIVCDGGYTCL